MKRFFSWGRTGAEQDGGVLVSSRWPVERGGQGAFDRANDFHARRMQTEGAAGAETMRSARVVFCARGAAASTCQRPSTASLDG